MLKRRRMEFIAVFVFILNLGKAKSEKGSSEENLPTLCHVCKHTVTEFLEELRHSENSRDVLQLGHVLQTERHKTIVYHKSGLRLIEALENTCAKINDYKVHKDKPNHLRYAKDESTTFTTLKNLKKRGVKVDLGFPDEMWDTPDAEIVDLKRQCENILEKHEEYLNDWYFNHQEYNLFDWFCKDRVLKQKDHACLKGTSNLEERKNKKIKKGERIDDDNDDDEIDEDDDEIDNDDDNGVEELKKQKRAKKKWEKKMKHDHGLEKDVGNDKEREQEEKKDDEKEKKKRNKKKRDKEKKNKYLKTQKKEKSNHIENTKKHHSEL